MTAKDYRLIAAAISQTMLSTIPDEDGSRAAQRGILAQFAQRLATDLAADNPRFKRDVFLAASGVSDNS